MPEKLPSPQDSPESFKDLSKTMSALRWLSPAKMWRINNIRQERAQLLDVLQRDSQEHFLGPDRLYRMQEYRGTEGKIVYEVLDGATGANPITGNLWSEVLLEMGAHLDVGRRTQIYTELLDAREQKHFARNRIDRVMAGLEQIDPEVAQRATDEDFFRENMLNMQSELIKDTFDKMFW